MCVALIKNKNVDLPNEDILKICFKNNPDGAGFAYCRNGNIIIRKGFFTFDGFYKALMNENIKKEESALIHFRVATHGKINIENCHPFPITDKFSKMTNPFSENNTSVMVHNGKLNINITSSIYSDSMHFAKTLFEFDRQNNKSFIDYIIRPTSKNKRGNRIGILNIDGTTEKYGVGWIEDNGIFYSNDSYKENSTYKGVKKTTKKTKTTACKTFTENNPFGQMHLVNGVLMFDD